MLSSSLLVCKNVLESDISGQHCAPSEPSILQQLEEVVVMPNYHRLFPGGARKLFNFFGSSYCDAAAKRLACWVSCLSLHTIVSMKHVLSWPSPISPSQQELYYLLLDFCCYSGGFAWYGRSL
jgi:hypothetical protein